MLAQKRTRKLINKSMKVFVAMSYQHKNDFEQEILSIRKACKEQGLDVVVFVQDFTFGVGEEKEMQKATLQTLDNCDILIAEVTHKAIGVGIEIGYAKAQKKRIIYIHRTQSEYSTTVGGVADYYLTYKNAHDLYTQLKPRLI